MVYRSKNDQVFRVINTILLLLVVFMCLYPLYLTVIASFSDAHEVVRGNVVLWPKGFTLESYQADFKYKQLWVGYRNTLIYTVVGTLYNLFLLMPSAYAMAKRGLKGKKVLMGLFVFTMYFSGGMIPTYLLVTNLGLYNSRWVMIIPSLLSTYNVMVCRSAFSGIPEEVIESAEIDGSNDFQTFFRIAVRLITPTLAVLTLYYAVAHWNDFFTALLYISDESLMPMQVLLRRVLIQSSSELIGNMVTDDKAAASIQIRYVTIVVATLPILVIYPLLQRYFVKGVMLGAVKG